MGPSPFELAIATHADSVPSTRTLQLVATVSSMLGDSIRDPSLSWSSSDPLVLQVDTHGAATAGRVGTAWIRVRFFALVDSTLLTVVPLVEKVTIATHPDSILALDSLVLRSTIRDGLGNVDTTIPVTWGSTDTSVARMGADGTLEARSVGSTVVHACSFGVCDSATVTVVPRIAQLRIDPHPDSLLNNASRALTARIRNGLGGIVPGTKVDWISRDTALATIGSDGTVLARHHGRVRLVATAEGLSDSTTLTIYLIVPKVIVTPRDSFARPGESIHYVATLTSDSGSAEGPYSIAWSSSDSATVSIDPAGTATPHMLDSTVISASIPGATGTAIARGQTRFRWISLMGEYGSCVGIVDGGTYCAGDPSWTAGPTTCHGGVYELCREFAPMPAAIDAIDWAIGSEDIFSLNWCALQSKTALCWGGDNDGIQDPGGPDLIRTIHPLNGLPPLDTISLGMAHACGLSAGSVVCWGDGAYGAIGDSSCTHSQCGPHVLSGLQATALASSWHRSCAAETDGHVACWGGRIDFDYDRSQWVDSFDPVVLDSITGAVAVAMTEQVSCALTAAGLVWCWGGSYSGELGTGPGINPHYHYPQRVLGAPPLITLQAGARQFCGLDADGGAWCWGYAGPASWPTPFPNTDACTANGFAAWCHMSPTRIAPDLHFTSLTLGGNTACGMATDGFAYCWGSRNQTGHNGEWGTWATTPERAGGQSP